LHLCALNKETYFNTENFCNLVKLSYFLKISMGKKNTNFVASALKRKERINFSSKCNFWCQIRIKKLYIKLWGALNNRDNSPRDLYIMTWRTKNFDP
jgi:hypothetical protein